MQKKRTMQESKKNRRIQIRVEITEYGINHGIAEVIRDSVIGRHFVCVCGWEGGG